MEYKLNATAAKKADNINSRIDEKGKYFGKFTRAEAVVSSKGTKGVDFSFVADNGATANYLTVWTHNASGEELHGYNLLMAIMMCLCVKTMQSSSAVIEKYVHELGRVEKVQASIYPDLMGKPIGLLIHMEEYRKNDGSTTWKPAISAPYNKDGFTASEISTSAATPATLEKMVTALRDRPLKSAPASSASQPEQQYGGSVFDDENIPF